MFYTNLLLTECEGSTGEYWPKVIPVRTSLCSICTKATEGQYSKVRLELVRLVSSLLYALNWGMLVLNLPAFENSEQLMTVSTVTVHVAKTQPRKKQSKLSDLPQDYFAI